jgi:hypothetical protein
MALFNARYTLCQSFIHCKPSADSKVAGSDQRQAKLLAGHRMELAASAAAYGMVIR